jgi:SM-20-related protein
MNAIFENAIEGMICNGFSITDDFINAQNVADLNIELDLRKALGNLKIADIGNKEALLDGSQRGDSTNWIEKEDITCAGDFLKIIENFRRYFNETCFLGLTKADIHFAEFPKGASYKKHLDAFTFQNKRKISIITYLNNEWTNLNGGELVIHKQRLATKITPLAGRMVCFESAKTLHEVLPSNRARRSITGWLSQ